MKKILMILIALNFSSAAMADPVKDFLITCGYGTLAGALAGVATVAFSENPSDKSMNIARGASLGLYAGIGFGLYQANQNARSAHEVHFWLEPQFHQKQAEGLKLAWVPLSF